MFRLSPRGAKFITDPPHEGLSLVSYLDSTSIWTIGFGTITINNSPVTKGMIINEVVAWALFYGKIQEYLNWIEAKVKVPLNQNQIDALTSLTYNIGKSAFSNSSLLTAINTEVTINESLFTRWNKITVNGILVPLNGLTNRRKREYELFMEKEES